MQSVYRLKMSDPTCTLIFYDELTILYMPPHDEAIRLGDDNNDAD